VDYSFCNFNYADCITWTTVQGNVCASRRARSSAPRYLPEGADDDVGGPCCLVSATRSGLFKTS
jgi:hypothetical protein